VEWDNRDGVELRPTKPNALRPGDRVAAVTLSGGGPGAVPWRYEAGKRQLETEFEIAVVEMPHTLRDPEWLAQNPSARADDLQQALEDDTIAGIVSTIGGSDSIRLLPLLDLEAITSHPKVFVGYSDTTVSHLAFAKAGVTSFYGPSVMAGFGENGGMHTYLVDSFRRTVMTPEAVGVVSPNRAGWTHERLPWTDPKNQTERRRLNEPIDWRFLQGTGRHSGRLIGGCVEVLDWLRGTRVWPTLDEWQGSILVLETSESGFSPADLSTRLRSLAAVGVLERTAGIIMGRPGGGVDPQTFPDYDAALLRIVRDEQGLTELPVVTRMDFGHTDPMMTLPFGVLAEIDCDTKTFGLTERAVVQEP